MTPEGRPSGPKDRQCECPCISDPKDCAASDAIPCPENSHHASDQPEAIPLWKNPVFEDNSS